MEHAFIDEYSDINSLIHRIEPRIKIISIITFIMFIISTKPGSFLSFLLYSVLIFLLILASRIPLVFIIRRSLVIIPFVLLITISVPFIKGQEAIGNYSIGRLNLTFYHEGLMVFLNILLKAYLSILCMILLMTSTKFNNFLKALEKLRLPLLITMILSFMYRYIFVIQDEVMKMKQAKDSRTVGGSHWFHFKIISNMIGVLFIRSFERAESVYLAMCSRGFDGRIKTLNELYITYKDWFFLTGIITLLIVIKLIGG